MPDRQDARQRAGIWGLAGHVGRWGIVMDRQAIIRNAFRIPEYLDEEMIAELVRQMTKDASLRQRNMRRTMNIGEVLDAAQIERGRKSAERHRRKIKAQQKPSWGAPIPAGVAIWD